MEMVKKKELMKNYIQSLYLPLQTKMEKLLYLQQNLVIMIQKSIKKLRSMPIIEMEM